MALPRSYMSARKPPPARWTQHERIILAIGLFFDCLVVALWAKELWPS